MKFLLSLFTKEIEDALKEVISPINDLVELYTFKDAKEYESKLIDIAKSLGVEEASDLNSLLKKLLEKEQ